MLKIYTEAELKEILRLHELWIQNDPAGVRANLSYANLSYADLSSANLSYADLRSTNLSRADLSSANLSYADLRSTNLSRADLRSANLSYADLRSANLSYADLRYADLRSTDLSYADLRSTNLSLVKNFSEFYKTQISPQKGSFIGFKKSLEGVIIELQIQEQAHRVNSPGQRKCRASFVKILKFHGSRKKELSSIYDGTFKYKIGQIIKIKNFNKDFTEDCGAGIHYFLTKEEAENYL